MQQIINIINNIFEKYYITEEIKDDGELKLILKVKVDKTLFNKVLSTLKDTQNLESVQNIILIGFWFDYYNEENEKPMRELLLLNFHDSHEDISSMFQSLWHNNTENIPILLKALENIPKYLQPEDFKYPYVRKIIYAIGAQPQPESLLALEKLASETNDEEIKKLALHQLEKRKRLGRWEAEGR